MFNTTNGLTATGLPTRLESRGIDRLLAWGNRINDDELRRDFLKHDPGKNARTLELAVAGSTIDGRFFAADKRRRTRYASS